MLSENLRNRPNIATKVLTQATLLSLDENVAAVVPRYHFIEITVILIVQESSVQIISFLKKFYILLIIIYVELPENKNILPMNFYIDLMQVCCR